MTSASNPLIRDQLFQEAVKKTGKNTNVGKEYKNQMIAAGYENVVEKVHIWPINRWPKDKKLKELGMRSPCPMFTADANIDEECGNLRTCGSASMR